MPKWVEWLKANAQPYEVQTAQSLFRELIDKCLGLGDSFIEWGFGTGYTSIALANKGKKVIGYDIEPELVEWAKATAEKKFVNKDGKVRFTSVLGEVDGADIVFSQGLFEHFSDEKIVDLIAQQTAYANKYVIFSVPSDNYPYDDFGDERKLSIKEWEVILEPFKNQLLELYYYDSRMHLMGVINAR